MKFTTKSSEVQRGPENYLRNFKKDAETKVRFLQDVDDWEEFWEHYSTDRKSFPCTGERDTCPGCTSDNEEVAKASRKYGTYVYYVKDGRTYPHRVPVGLRDAVERRKINSGGTNTDRDYIVIRSGKGFETSYELERDEKYDMDLEAQLATQKHTINDILTEAYEAVWGIGSATVDEKPEKEVKGAHPKREAVTKEEPEEVPPTKPAEEDVVVDEAHLRGMSFVQLTQLATNAGLAIPDNIEDKDGMLDFILAAAG